MDFYSFFMAYMEVEGCGPIGKQPILLSEEIIPPAALVRAGLETPAIIGAQGERAGRRFIEFFTATIRNRNTRMTYARGKTLVACVTLEPTQARAACSLEKPSLRVPSATVRLRAVDSSSAQLQQSYR